MKDVWRYLPSIFNSGGFLGGGAVFKLQIVVNKVVVKSELKN